MRFVLLSLMLLMSLIQQYNCWPSDNSVPKQDSSVQITDSVHHLISLLEKEINTDDKSDENVRTENMQSATIAEDDRSAYIIHDDDDVDPCRGRPVKMTKSSGTIVLPEYSSWSYPNHAHCQWTIEAPAGYVISIIVKAKLDDYRLTLSDRATAWNHVMRSSRKDSVTSPGNAVKVDFKTYGSMNKDDFLLKWIFFLARETYGSMNKDDFLLKWIFFLARGPQCGRPAIQPDVAMSRIVGGKIAKPNSWPWQCMLSTGCGASVISNRYILSAAHCFFKDDYTRIPEDEITVYCGIHNSAKRNNDHRVQKFTNVKVALHPVYRNDSRTWLSDIALIHVPRPLVFTDFVQPVCLPRSPVDADIGCIVTGFGLTEYNKSSIFLRQVGVPILDNNRCQKHYFANLVPSKQICAGTADEHTCRGDSGGPLVCKHSGKWWQYGIVSYGKKYCVTTRYPSVYTDVVAHLRWIQQTSGIGSTASVA